MTRLYYGDSLLTSFDAVVTSCESAGDVFHVTLDQTAFYPTSGGQPFDTGTLGGAHVIDVVDDEATGRVVHVVGAPLARNVRVRGEIDRDRRLDHMQQHTGQHMLSAAFDRLFGVRTTSFHMSAETSTIDLARDVSPAEIDRAVAEANRVVWDDREVSVRYATDAEAAALPLRKESQRTGLLRLVEIPDFDLSACGGTHVPRTGMIGLIAVTAWERFKGGSRVTFVCGRRALTALSRLRDLATAAARALTIAPDDLPAAVGRMQADIKEQQRRVKKLQDEVAMHLATSLRAEAVAGRDGARVVIREQAGWDAAALKFLASAIVSVPGFVVVLTGEGEPVPVVVARSQDQAFDAGVWIKETTGALGGRGGGRPEMAQGGVTADASAILARAADTLR